jgi:hypothetical protein
LWSANINFYLKYYIPKDTEQYINYLEQASKKQIYSFATIIVIKMIICIFLNINSGGNMKKLNAAYSASSNTLNANSSEADNILQTFTTSEISRVADVFEQERFQKTSDLLRTCIQAGWFNSMSVSLIDNLNYHSHEN